MVGVFFGALPEVDLAVVFVLWVVEAEVSLCPDVSGLSAEEAHFLAFIIAPGSSHKRRTVFEILILLQRQS